MALQTLLSILCAYLIGSIPFAFLISRLYGVDIRKVGDGNAGTINVCRHVGLTAGILTLIADIAKGACAIIVARALVGSGATVFIAGVIAVIGHILPVFMRFRGGRGVGTVIGVLWIFIPIEMSITFVLGTIVVLVTRNTMWMGIALFIPLPVLCLIFREPYILAIYSIAMPCLSGLAHLFTTRNLSKAAKKEAQMFWIEQQKHK